MCRNLAQTVNVGIFWYIAGSVYGATESLEIEANAVLGKVDSHFEHWRIWEISKHWKGISVNREGQEYFAFPRGRVIYNVTLSLYIVYCDRKLLSPVAKEKIASFFGIEVSEAKWKGDLHYTTDKNEIRDLLEGNI